MSFSYASFLSSVAREVLYVQPLYVPSHNTHSLRCCILSFPAVRILLLYKGICLHSPYLHNWSTSPTFRLLQSLLLIFRGFLLSLRSHILSLLFSVLFNVPKLQPVNSNITATAATVHLLFFMLPFFLTLLFSLYYLTHYGCKKCRIYAIIENTQRTWQPLQNLWQLAVSLAYFGSKMKIKEINYDKTYFCRLIRSSISDHRYSGSGIEWLIGKVSKKLWIIPVCGWFSGHLRWSLSLPVSNLPWSERRIYRKDRFLYRKSQKLLWHRYHLRQM